MLDTMWGFFVIAFICGAAWMWVLMKGREFWPQWVWAWREERRLKREIANAKLAEGRR